MPFHPMPWLVGALLSRRAHGPWLAKGADCAPPPVLRADSPRVQGPSGPRGPTGPQGYPGDNGLEGQPGQVRVECIKK